MMDDLLQRDVAKLMVTEFEERKIEVVLVGSTAIVALKLFPKTSRDADALAPATLSLDDARDVMKEIGQKLQLRLEERGWGTLSLVKYDDGGKERWRMDLLVPDGGPIPIEAALLIQKHAVKTDIGRCAIPEHILVTKAVAWGDSHGKNDPQRAAEYESDIMELRNRLKTSVNWKLAHELLNAYQSARANAAAELLNEKFGASLRLQKDAENWS